MKLQTILRVVANHAGLTIGDLKGPRRSASISKARQIAMHLCRVRTSASLPEIGKALCKDHSSVAHGHASVSGEMATDQALFDEVMGLHLLLDRLSGERPTVPLCTRCRTELRHGGDPFIDELVAAGIRRPNDFTSTLADRASTRPAGSDADQNNTGSTGVVPTSHHDLHHDGPCTSSTGCG